MARISTIKRLSLTALAGLALACSGHPIPIVGPATTSQATLALLSTLADDSLEGRRTGERGATRAAGVIARAMVRIGLGAGGDSGYYQRLPVATGARVINDRPIAAPVLLPSFAARDSLHPSKRLPAYNVIGILPGADPQFAAEHLLIGAHYDHLGIRPNGTTDSIYNGADDDASGVVAILEIARILKEGEPLKRTVIFAAWTGEETGLLGARWYSDHPTRPLAQMVANLEVEMIGRPDSLAGGPGKAWLTGYERSTLGDLLKASRISIGPDKRPEQEFFRRSDNYQFALRGIVAHTVSSYNMHDDYHRASDEVSRIDGAHMAAVINLTARAVRILADGPKPTWKPNGQPTQGNRP